MKLVVYISLFLFSVSGFSQTPDFVWVKQMSGAGDQQAISIAVDGSGNSYSTGYFEGLVDFDPGVGTFTLNSPGYKSTYVLKLDAQGNFVWAKQLGGSPQLSIPDDTRPSALSLGTGTSIIVTGSFEGLVDLDPDAGNSLFYNSLGGTAFILKLDLQGAYIWARQLSQTSLSTGSGLVTDPAGNIYTTGGFMNLVDFDPGVTTYTLNASNGMATYISKLDANGNFLWATQLETSSISSGFVITLDAAGNIFCAGAFSGMIDLDPNAGVDNIISNSGSQDGYIVKLDPQGNYQWGKMLGGNGVDGINSLTPDPNGGICLSGFFETTIDLDPGAAIQNVSSAGDYDFFILKLDTQGQLVWAHATGGISTDFVSQMVSDASGNVYSTGAFGNTVDFDPGATTLTFSAVDRNAFLSKYDSQGNLIWAKQFSGTSYCGGASLALSATSELYSTGSFSSTVDFDPGALTFSLSATGVNDTYVHKMTCDASPVLTVNSSAAIICSGSSATLNVAGANTYSWNGTSGSSNFVVAPLANTDYTVIGTNAVGCSAMLVFTQSVSACTGIKQTTEDSSAIDLFPNPANEKVTVISNVPEDGSVIRIVSLTGQIQQEQLWGQANTRLDIQQLAEGIYFVQFIENSQLKKTIKLIRN